MSEHRAAPRRHPRRATDPDGPTGRLSSWVAGLRLEDVPGPVVDRTVHLVLDGIGCGLLAARLPWSATAMEAVCELDGEGPASVWGWGRRTSPGAAALLNGTFVQGFELDDYHPDGPLHSQACVVPSVLATAEHLTGAPGGGVSGRDLLEAIMAGFEVGPRIGMALGGLSLVARGWHCGSVYGTLASAVAAARLRGLDAAGVEDAIGMAATQASGLMSAQYEAMVKRMHSGLAARNGLYAAALADRGFSGIKRVIERDYGGYASTFSSPEDIDLDLLVDDLGERWEIQRIAVKPPYACMAGLHSTIDGLLGLLADGRVTAERTSRLRIGVGEAMFKHAGWRLERPAEVIGAQMNLAYGAAVTLLDRAAFVPQFSPPRLERDDVWEMLERVEVRWDPDIDRLGAPARWTSRLHVELDDGTCHDVETREPWGSPRRPLTNGEIVDKFRRMLHLVTDAPDRADALVAAVLSVADGSDVRELGDLVRAPVAEPFARAAGAAPLTGAGPSGSP